jgi:DICT domain-containing protein
MDTIELRNDVADRIFADFEFSVPVVDADGWEFTTPGVEMIRKVYFDTDATQSEAGHLTIVFDGIDSAQPIEAYAMLRGNFAGQLSAADLAKYAEPDAASPAP